MIVIIHHPVRNRNKSYKNFVVNKKDHLFYDFVINLISNVKFGNTFAIIQEIMCLKEVQNI